MTRSILRFEKRVAIKKQPTQPPTMMKRFSFLLASLALLWLLAATTCHAVATKNPKKRPAKHTPVRAMQHPSLGNGHAYCQESRHETAHRVAQGKWTTPLASHPSCTGHQTVSLLSHHQALDDKAQSPWKLSSLLPSRKHTCHHSSWPPIISLSFLSHFVSKGNSSRNQCLPLPCLWGHAIL